jgi:hypothetical protein
MAPALQEAPTGADEDLAEGTASGPDADKGKLFEVPRVAVLIDEADPGVIKLAFSGSVELDRSNADDVAFYNRLKAGKDVSLDIEAFVAGPKNSHRRDSDGNVDAVVQTKSLIVHSIDVG